LAQNNSEKPYLKKIKIKIIDIQCFVILKKEYHGYYDSCLKFHSFYVFFPPFVMNLIYMHIVVMHKPTFATRLKAVFIMEKYNLENSSFPIQNKGFVATLTFVFYLSPS
jgi:hypothetical protein